jgi:phosphoglycolate phosphatase
VSRQIEHVIFDLDGTLVDSRADLANAVNHVRRQYGLAALEPATLHRYVGDGARALIERAMGLEYRSAWDGATDLFLLHYRKHLLDESCLYPGVGDLLRAIRQSRVPMSVLTNKPESLSRRILDGLGVGGWFVDVVGGDRLPTRKPDPAGALHLLHVTDTPPQRAVIVGDSPVDAATAKASGTGFCGVTWGFNPSGLIAEGMPLAHTATDLGAFLLQAW